MDGRIEAATGKLGYGVAARKNGKCWDAADRECLEVVAAKEKDDVGFGLVEKRAELANGGDACVELGGVFVRRARKELRRVTGGHGGDYFSHCVLV